MTSVNLPSRVPHLRGPAFTLPPHRVVSYFAVTGERTSDREMAVALAARAGVDTRLVRAEARDARVMVEHADRRSVSRHIMVDHEDVHPNLGTARDATPHMDWTTSVLPNPGSRSRCATR